MNTVESGRRRVPLSTKIIQGTGAMPEHFVYYAFGTLLLFYYNQVLGVSGTLCGYALGIATFFDAINDPMIGSASDNFRSRLGRRHPFMYVSAIPVGVTLYLLFKPVEGLSEFQLFIWLAIFAVLLRSFLTMFSVPWAALQAELSQDYHERTSIVAFRTLFAVSTGAAVGFCVMRFLFPTTPEYTPGLLNPAGYPLFGTIASVAAVAVILFTTHFSRKEIPYLPKVSGDRQPFSLLNVVKEVGLALQNKMFVLFFSTTLFTGALVGTTMTLTVYMQTYFWGLMPEEIAWYSLSFIGALTGFAVIKPLQARFDKKHIALFSWTMGVVDGLCMINLRLFDVLPPNGNPWLLRILVANAIFTALITSLGQIIGPSLIADVLDQQELQTGKRQEGVFFSASGFAYKAIFGLGVFFGGLIVDWLRLPQGVNPALVDPTIIRNLGIVAGICIPSLMLLPVFAYGYWYNITREKHAEIRAALDKRYAEQAAAASQEVGASGDTQP